MNGPAKNSQEINNVAPHLRLGVNIDHVATVRNARGGAHPDPVRAALTAEDAGADGITAHLREDRRHITDVDILRLMAELEIPLNLEMAATDEMLAIALKHKVTPVTLATANKIKDVNRIIVGQNACANHQMILTDA